MPKKNGFYFFMTKRREEMETSGVKITRGFAEVAELINQEWLKMTEEDKAVYKEIAQKYNENLAETKKKSESESSSASSTAAATSDAEGFMIGTHQLSIEEVQAKFEALTAEGDLSAIPIVLIQFSAYCDTSIADIRIAEVGINAFSIRNGIFNQYASLIDPKEYPEKDHGKVTASCKKYALPMPNYSERVQNYKQIVKDMGWFMKFHSKDFFKETTVFCRASNLNHTEVCMNWLFSKVEKKFHFPYKLLPIEPLIQMMSSRHYAKTINEKIRTGNREEEGETAELDENPELSIRQRCLKAKEDATSGYVVYPAKCPFVRHGVFFETPHIDIFLHYDNYAYHQELSCLYHVNRGDGVYYCPLNLANRYAYCLLDVLVNNFEKVITIPGEHYPTLKKPEEERQRRRNVLDKWALMDYNKLAADERVNDKDFEVQPHSETFKEFLALASSSNSKPKPTSSFKPKPKHTSSYNKKALPLEDK